MQPTLEYRWKPGSHMKGSAAATQAALDGVADATGSITPEAVRAAARADPQSPFWANMTADPDEALDHLQLIQAGRILNSIEVVRVRGEVTTTERTWVNVRVTEPGALQPTMRVFRHTERVARSVPDSRSALAILLANLIGVERGVEDLVRALADEGTVDIDTTSTLYEHLKVVRVALASIQALAQDL